MNTTRVIYHLARADFLERVRRYSFFNYAGLGCISRLPNCCWQHHHAA